MVWWRNVKTLCEIHPKLVHIPKLKKQRATRLHCIVLLTYLRQNADTQVYEIGTDLFHNSNVTVIKIQCTHTMLFANTYRVCDEKCSISKERSLILYKLFITQSDYYDLHNETAMSVYFKSQFIYNSPPPPNEQLATCKSPRPSWSNTFLASRFSGSHYIDIHEVKQWSTAYNSFLEFYLFKIKIMSVIFSVFVRGMYILFNLD